MAIHKNPRLFTGIVEMNECCMINDGGDEDIDEDDDADDGGDDDDNTDLCLRIQNRPITCSGDSNFLLCISSA